jgi:hypothetical protein
METDQSLPPEPPKRPRRRRPYACCLALCLIQLTLALGAAAATYWLIPPYTWRGWVDDERKTPPAWVPRGANPNAADTYAPLVGLATSESESALVDRWRRAVASGDEAQLHADRAAIMALISSRAAAFTALHDGADQQYAAGKQPAPDTLFPELPKYRSVARLAAAAAGLEFAEERDDEALALLEDVASLGAHLDSGEAALQLLVGASIVTIQHRVAITVILEGRPSPRALRHHIERMGELAGRPSGLQSTIAYEAACQDVCLDQVARQGLNELWLRSRFERAWQIDLAGPELQAERQKLGSTIAWVHDRYARMMEEVVKPAHERDTEAFQARTNADAAARGDMLAPLSTAVIASWCKRSLQMDATLDAEATMCALELYRREHGAYPATLDALVPAYLPEVPEDPYSGEPFVYRPEGEPYTLYCLGPNKIDDGGVSERPRALEPDLVLVGGTFLRPSSKDAPATESSESTSTQSSER